MNRLHKSFQSFFYRIKRGENPGFPRFKGKDRQIRSFETGQFNIKQQGKYNIVKIKGIGKFRFKGEVPENIKFVRIVKTPLRVKIQLIHEKELNVVDDSRKPLGIDVGIKSRITLSNGIQVTKRIRNKDRIKSLQQRIARCQKSSNNRKKLLLQKQKEEQRIQERERGYVHEVTANLIKNQSSKFVIEDLDIVSMSKKGKGKFKKSMNRNMLEQTWGLFYQLLNYKAENAGGWVKRINPKNTTQRCSSCGLLPEKKLTLRDRMYECKHCSHSMDRDINASINILREGLSPQGYNTQKYILKVA